LGFGAFFFFLWLISPLQPKKKNLLPTAKGCPFYRQTSRAFNGLIAANSSLGHFIKQLTLNGLYHPMVVNPPEL